MWANHEKLDFARRRGQQWKPDTVASLAAQARKKQAAQ